MPEIIDLTDRYDRPEFQRGGAPAINRQQDRVLAIVQHHAAGWYGRALGPGASRGQEVAQLDAMAVDHNVRLAIGPAYNYVGFPGSGRMYAVGKVGVRRAHTKGRSVDLEGHPWWNIAAIGVCAMGNYDADPITPQLVEGLELVYAEIRSWPFSDAGAAVFAHGIASTLDDDGSTPLDQATACPGKDLRLWVLDSASFPPPQPEPPQDPRGPGAEQLRAWAVRAADLEDRAQSFGVELERLATEMTAAAERIER